MKIRIDNDLCSGFGICVGILPELFELHEDGYAMVLMADVPPDYEDLARRAADQCPARAILVDDDGA